MKKLITVAVAATAVLAALPGSASAAQEPFAKVISHVKLNKKTTPQPCRRVTCASHRTHLWVSAKQTADGSIDEALESEGSSGAAAAWMDTNDWVTVGQPRSRSPAATSSSSATAARTPRASPST